MNEEESNGARSSGPASAARRVSRAASTMFYARELNEFLIPHSKIPASYKKNHRPRIGKGGSQDCIITMIPPVAVRACFSTCNLLSGHFSS